MSQEGYGLFLKICATISLQSPDDVRPLLAAANEAVHINSFRHVLPSMDDIFVAAVSASNSESKQ